MTGRDEPEDGPDLFAVWNNSAPCWRSTRAAYFDFAFALRRAVETVAGIGGNMNRWTAAEAFPTYVHLKSLEPESVQFGFGWQYLTTVQMTDFGVLYGMNHRGRTAFGAETEIRWWVSRDGEDQQFAVKLSKRSSAQLAEDFRYIGSMPSPEELASATQLILGSASRCR